MKFDQLGEPISADNPAGPDLDEEMDPDYMNYALLAESRLPARFFGDDNQPFDRTTIELDSEMEAIEGFLEQSRDARMVTLAARFQALAGSITGFSEVVQGLALMVNGLWAEFHPRESDGDLILRQNTIESLDDQVTVVLPLQHAIIGGGGRTEPVSLRQYLVASGKTPARENEVTVVVDTIASSLAAETSLERVMESYEAAQNALAALESIRKAFMDNEAAAYLPSFERVTETLKGIVDLIAANRPELAPATPTEEAGDEGAPGGATGGGPNVVAGAVKSHAAAAKALSAAESYLLRMEPSSPALILVHQARILIGRPLVEALEALLPSPSERAALRFDAGLQFDIDLTRMRSVTEHALSYSEMLLAEEDAEDAEAAGADSGWDSYSEPEPEPEVEAPEPPEAADDDSLVSSDSEGDEAAPAEPEREPEPEPQPEPPPAPVAPPGPEVIPKFRARTRNQASDLLSATEGYFRSAEPSSPLPILLAKARGYLNRDFASILNELIPRESE